MKQLNWYQIFGNTHTIPEGSTVTPTDDVQILLHCANIWDKSYTTIGEVIADDDTLFLTLIDNNAIDYLVRSTTFASSIVADESAMQYIGASDYASETLMSDSTWAEAILNSAYYELVVDSPLIPYMTSNTTPSGVASASSSINNDNLPWMAFNEAPIAGVARAKWHSAMNPSLPQWLRYQFPKGKVARWARVQNWQGNPAPGAKFVFKIQGSNDASTWVDLTDTITMDYEPNWLGVICELTNDTSYMYYQLYFTSYVTATAILIQCMQLYDRQIGGVQSWLKAGGITNKKYTTVSEVLSDLTTLATLMSSSDAIDYLVTAKGWATEICSDSNAMADIGMNNYAANTLLADETWGTAICESTYFTSVLNVASPDMTSSTTPYGEATGSTPVGSNPAWQAFNSNPSLQWVVSNYGSPYIQYKFTSEVRIFCYALMGSPKSGSSPTNRLKDYRIYASNTSADMSSHLLKTAVWDSSISSDSAARRFYLPTEESYQYYLLVADSMYSGSDYRGVAVLKFYGRKDI